MMDDVMPLDGNAAAGRLAELFAVEMTRATIVCAGCGNEGPLATLRLYGGGVGTVLRCPACDAVNLRLLDTGTTLNLDLRGCTRLTVRAPADG
jgi:Zn finger protein HypA/HybF involved in hydrogenase expression